MWCSWDRAHLKVQKRSLNWTPMSDFSICQIQNPTQMISDGIYICVSHVFWHARVWKGLDECCGVGAAFPPATLQTSRWVSLLDSNASMTQGTLARLPWATQEQFGNWTWPAKIEAKSISSLITMERRSASTPRSCTWTRQESQGLGIKPSSQESNHLKSKLLQVLGRSSVLAEMTAVRNASSSTTCV